MLTDILGGLVARIRPGSIPGQGTSLYVYSLKYSILHNAEVLILDFKEHVYMHT